MVKVFISYRREPSAMLANLVWLELRNNGIRAFLDTRDLKSAGTFPEMLRREIEQCDALVCLLESTTLQSEWVREEVRYAYSLGKTLIPVFQDYHAPLDEKALPDYLQALFSSNGVHISDKSMFLSYSIGDLLKLLGSVGVVSRDTASEKQFPQTMAVNILKGSMDKQYAFEVVVGNTTGQNLWIDKATMLYLYMNPPLLLHPDPLSLFPKYTYSISLDFKSSIEGDAVSVVTGIAVEQDDTWGREISGQIITRSEYQFLFSISFPLLVNISPRTRAAIRFVLEKPVRKIEKLATDTGEGSDFDETVNRILSILNGDVKDEFRLALNRIDHFEKGHIVLDGNLEKPLKASFPVNGLFSFLKTAEETLQ